MKKITVIADETVDSNILREIAAIIKSFGYEETPGSQAWCRKEMFFHLTENLPPQQEKPKLLLRPKPEEDTTEIKPAKRLL